MSKSKPITPRAAIFYGGLIAGILDATDGVVAYYLIGGLEPDPGSANHRQRLLWSGRFSKGNFRRLGGSPRPFFHRLRGRRHLRGSNPVSAHVTQGRGNVGHDLRRRAVFILMNFVVLPHTAVAKITLLFAPLAERGSNARCVGWLTDRLGSPR